MIAVVRVRQDDRRLDLGRLRPRYESRDDPMVDDCRIRVKSGLG